MTVALVDKIAWPISSNYSIKPGVDTVGKGGYNLLATTSDPDAVIESLFANGEQGAWYDPSDFGTMLQDRFGMTPVTADSQTIGLFLDKSKGVALGSELITNGAFASDVSGWSIMDGSGSLTWDSGAALLSATSSPSACQSFATVSGKWYKLSVSIVSATASAGVTVGNGSAFGYDRFYTANAAGAREISGYFVAIGANSTICLYAGGTTGVNAMFDNVSVKEVAGNHAVAPSDAARPLKASTGLCDLINYDAVDDVLNVTFPSSLGAACTVCRANPDGAPTILTAQTIGTSYADSTDHAGLIIINRALTGQETTDVTAWLTDKGLFF
jgi:hypothetical protein